MKRTDPDFDLVTEWTLDARPEELSDIVLDPDHLRFWCPGIFMKGDVLDRGAPDGLGLTIGLQAKRWLPHSFHFVARIVELERR